MSSHSHHFVHFIMYSLLGWQVLLGCWLIVRYFLKNFPLNTTHPPEVKIHTVGSVDLIPPSSQTAKLVEVETKKKIFGTAPDKVSVQMDEKIKGKVKTQKDKLKRLRT